MLGDRVHRGSKQKRRLVLFYWHGRNCLQWANYIQGITRGTAGEGTYKYRREKTRENCGAGTGTGSTGSSGIVTHGCLIYT